MNARAERPPGPGRLAVRLEPILRASPAEQPRLALAVAYIFLVVASISLVKPLRNALFIEAFGIAGLPYAYLGVAAASALFIWFYSRVSARVGTRILVLSSLWAGCAGLLAFWLVLRAGEAGLGPDLLRSSAVAAFYVVLAVFGVIASSQVWVLANLAFDARQAKRLFGTVATGGIAGGIVGGYLTSALAPRWGGSCLLLLGAALLAAAVWAADGLWRRAASADARVGGHSPAKNLSLGLGESVRGLWRDVAQSPHATWLALMVGLATVAGSLAEFQFSALAAASIPDGDRLTAFFGFWLSNLGVFSLVVQLAFSYSMLRRHGVGASLLVLPLAVAGGGLAVLAWPSLWTGIAAKIGDASLKHSLNKSATELLYLPLPARLRERAKMLIDVFVDNLATGLAGALLLTLSSGPGLSPRMVSGLLLLLVAAWIPVILRVREEYLGSFRKAMEKRALNASQQTLPIGEAGLLDSLTKALGDGNPRRVLYTLDWLELPRGDRRVAALSALLAHPDAGVRRKALQVLRRGRHDGFGEDARRLVRDDPDRRIRLEALRYLLGQGADPVSLALPYLMGGETTVKVDALHALCLEAKRRPALHARVDWRSLLDSVGPDGAGGASAGRAFTERDLRIARARLIGVSRLPEAHPELRGLIADADLEVRRAALEAAGDAHDPALLPDVYPHLVSQPTRPLARAAIAAVGDPAVPALRAALADPHLPQAIRRLLPGVLGALGSQSAATVLMELLPTPDFSLRFEAIKALNVIKRVSPHFRFPAELLERAIRVEIVGCRDLDAALARVERALAGYDPGLPDPGRLTSGLRLLARGLNEKGRQARERLFRLLGLRFHAEDIYGAYMGLSSGNATARANAVEFLDNVLPRRLMKDLLPLVEPDSPALARPVAWRRASETESSWPAWLEGLLAEGQDAWIRALALHLAVETDSPALLARARALANHPDARIRAMVRSAAEPPQSHPALLETDAQPH